MVEIYVKLPPIDDQCGHCKWLEQAHREAAADGFMSIQILAKQLLIVHLIQSHGMTEIESLPW